MNVRRRGFKLKPPWTRHWGVAAYTVWGRIYNVFYENNTSEFEGAKGIVNAICCTPRHGAHRLRKGGMVAREILVIAITLAVAILLYKHFEVAEKATWCAAQLESQTAELNQLSKECFLTRGHLEEQKKVLQGKKLKFAIYIIFYIEKFKDWIALEDNNNRLYSSWCVVLPLSQTIYDSIYNYVGNKS